MDNIVIIGFSKPAVHIPSKLMATQVIWGPQINLEDTYLFISAESKYSNLLLNIPEGEYSVVSREDRFLVVTSARQKVLEVMLGGKVALLPNQCVIGTKYDAFHSSVSISPIVLQALKNLVKVTFNNLK